MKQIKKLICHSKDRIEDFTEELKGLVEEVDDVEQTPAVVLEKMRFVSNEEAKVCRWLSPSSSL